MCLMHARQDLVSNVRPMGCYLHQSVSQAAAPAILLGSMLVHVSSHLPAVRAFN